MSLKGAEELQQTPSGTTRVSTGAEESKLTEQLRRSEVDSSLDLWSRPRLHSRVSGSSPAHRSPDWFSWVLIATVSVCVCVCVCVCWTTSATCHLQLHPPLCVGAETGAVNQLTHTHTHTNKFTCHNKSCEECVCV